LNNNNNNNNSNNNNNMEHKRVNEATNLGIVLLLSLNQISPCLLKHLEEEWDLPRSKHGEGDPPVLHLLK